MLTFTQTAGVLLMDLDTLDRAPSLKVLSTMASQRYFNMVSCGMNKWFHYLIHHFLLVKTNSSIKIQININQMVLLWYEQLVL